MVDLISALSCVGQGKDLEKAQKLYARAMSFFKHVLERNNANVYAANGIAAILAEQGDIEPARKVLTQVLSCDTLFSCQNLSVWGMRCRSPLGRQ